MGDIPFEEDDWVSPGDMPLSYMGRRTPNNCVTFSLVTDGKLVR